MKAKAPVRKVFHYRLPAAPPKAGPVDRPRAEKAGEVLTHIVQGQYASDLEERFARGLDRSPRVLRYDFQVSYAAGRNLPGELRPDFIVYAPIMQPVQVDGAFSHKTAEQHETDKVKDALLDFELKGSGALPTVRIPDTKLGSAAQVDETLRELLI